MICLSCRTAATWMQRGNLESAQILHARCPARPHADGTVRVDGEARPTMCDCQHATESAINKQLVRQS